MPPAVVALVTTGVAEPILIVTAKGTVETPVMFVALTDTANEPATPGLPEITPEVGSSASPDGSAPETIE